MLAQRPSHICMLMFSDGLGQASASLWMATCFEQPCATPRNARMQQVRWLGSVLPFHALWDEDKNAQALKSLFCYLPP